ncbi:hypothetical protein [Acidithiobacillus ferrooxidans]|uniref:hypothetical protein n=1 Tax=Acidithiobacillus ferrooxidans TaxID=920 RepID=UPI001D01EE80|nr:hypothetical protein [Acidithiobacillus ferrooxidans]
MQKALAPSTVRKQPKIFMDTKYIVSIFIISQEQDTDLGWDIALLFNDCSMR